MIRFFTFFFCSVHSFSFAAAQFHFTSLFIIVNSCNLFHIHFPPFPLSRPTSITHPIHHHDLGPHQRLLRLPPIRRRRRIHEPLQIRQPRSQMVPHPLPPRHPHQPQRTHHRIPPRLPIPLRPPNPTRILQYLNNNTTNHHPLRPKRSAKTRYNKTLATTWGRGRGCTGMGGTEPRDEGYL